MSTQPRLTVRPVVVAAVQGQLLQGEAGCCAVLPAREVQRTNYSVTIRGAQMFCNNLHAWSG
jgi:hypothetical protein